MEIARPRADVEVAPGALSSESGDVIWDEIVSITPAGREQVYDIEVEGTHNFVGNGIFAHNTYVLRANTMLAVTGEVNAGDFTVPLSDGVPAFGTTTLMAEIPSAVLTADGKGVDLYKLSTYNLGAVNVLAARLNDDEVRLTSLESRVEKLETGAIGTGSTTVNIGTGLASAFNAFGAFISKGIAQFGSLVADRFVAATNSAGTSSAGTVTVLTGNTVAQVTNAYVLPTSKIFVTFNSQITGSWWVSDKTAGSFRVVLSAAQAGDVSFDYFLVQTEGQIATSTPNNTSGSQTSTGPTTITLLGANPFLINVGSSFTDPGISVSNGAPYITFINGVEQAVSAGTIDTTNPTTYLITYKATDAAGNTATAMRSVIVGNPDGTVSSGGTTASSTPASTDTTPPVVTLNGAAAMQLTVGDTFTDPGATATDNVDGDLTSKIIVTGTVNTATAGSYTLSYTATDKAGNIGTASRLVSVLASTPAPVEPAPAPAPSGTPAPAPTTP
jgi:hypothetical protein